MIEVTLTTGEKIALANTTEARSILHRAGAIIGRVVATEKGTGKRVSVALSSVAMVREVDTTRR